MFRKLLDEAELAITSAALLRGVQRKKSNVDRYCLNRAAFIRTPNSKAEVYVLTKEGWTSHSILQQLPSAVLFQNNDVTGVTELPEGVEMCMPGDNVEMTSLSKKVCVSLSVKAAVPLALALFPK